MNIREHMTEVPYTYEMLQRVADNLDKSPALDDEGTYFAVYHPDLMNAVHIINQLASQIEGVNP